MASGIKITITVLSLLIIFGLIFVGIKYLPRTSSQSVISLECSKFGSSEDFIVPGFTQKITAPSNQEILWRVSTANPYVNCEAITNQDQCNDNFNCEWSGLIGFRSCKEIPNAKPSLSDCIGLSYTPFDSGIVRRGETHNFFIPTDTCGVLYQEFYKCTDPCGSEPTGSSCDRDCECSSNNCLGGICTPIKTSICGNNICELDENRFNCPQDCEPSGGAVCGNLICENGETTSSCPSDCVAGTRQCWELLASGTTCQLQNIPLIQPCSSKGYYSSQDECLTATGLCPPGQIVKDLVCVDINRTECSSCFSWGWDRLFKDELEQCTEATVWELVSDAKWYNPAGWFNIAITQDEWCPVFLIGIGSIVFVTLTIIFVVIWIGRGIRKRRKK